MIEAPAVEIESRLPAAVRPDQRIPALDGLRACASLMVVCYHFGPRIVPESGSWFHVLRSLPDLWFQGVPLFFVLSGFLISGILVGERNSPRYFKTFYARRAFRIFPLYYLVFFTYCAALALLGTRTARMGWLFEHPLPLWPYLLYLQNFSMAAFNTFGPNFMSDSWSLAVEEQFYFTFPAIVRFVSRRILLRLTVGAIVGAPILRALVQKFKFLPGRANYLLLPANLDCLAVGVLVMLLLRNHCDYLESRLKQLRVGVGVAFIGWSAYPYLPNPQAIRMTFIERTVTSLVFGGLLLMILLAPAGRIARFLSRPGMRLLGNMAYSTYLFHLTLLCVAFLCNSGRESKPCIGARSRAVDCRRRGDRSAFSSSWNVFRTPSDSGGTQISLRPMHIPLIKPDLPTSARRYPGAARGNPRQRPHYQFRGNT